MQKPRLRDGNKKTSIELYPIGQLPSKALVEIGKAIAYKIAVCQTDISGDDWGDIFADAFGAEHLASPLGLVDVLFEKMAWSTKTVKAINPHTATNIRVISGRWGKSRTLCKL